MENGTWNSIREGFMIQEGSLEIWDLRCWHEHHGGIRALLADVSLDSTVAGN